MSDSRQLAVILVEEQPRVLTLLERVLPEFPGSPDLVLAYDGFDALDMVSRCLVPLVILPYELAAEDGLELSAAIKDASPSTKVILTAASTLSNLERNAQAAGVDYFLPEPYEIGRLEEVVRDALGIQVRVVGAYV